MCVQSHSYKVTHTKSLLVCVQSHSYKSHSYKVTFGCVYKVAHTKSLILSHFRCVYKATHTKSLILSHFRCVYKATHTKSLIQSHFRVCIQSCSYKVSHTKPLILSHFWCVYKATHTKPLIQSHSYKVTFGVAWWVTSALAHVHQVAQEMWVGLVRSVYYVQHTWPYVWYFPCQNYRADTVCVYFPCQQTLCWYRVCVCTFPAKKNTLLIPCVSIYVWIWPTSEMGEQALCYYTFGLFCCLRRPLPPDPQ